MQFRERKRVRLGLEIAPLVDVIFLLLIFFLLSSPFVFQPGIRVRLPEATTEDVQPRNIFITITKDGVLYLNGEITDIETLPSQLKGLILENGERFVIIKADKDTRHERVVEVLDVSKMVGIEKLGIATSLKKMIDMEEEEGGDD